MDITGNIFLHVVLRISRRKSHYFYQVIFPSSVDCIVSSLLVLQVTVNSGHISYRLVTGNIFYHLEILYVYMVTEDDVFPVLHQRFVEDVDSGHPRTPGI